MSVPSTAGAEDEQLLALGRLLLQQHEQSLQSEVGVAWPDGSVVQQPLNVVHQDTAQSGSVCVIEVLSTLWISKLKCFDFHFSDKCLENFTKR